jgi:hypothetical protein
MPAKANVLTRAMACAVDRVLMPRDWTEKVKIVVTFRAAGQTNATGKRRSRRQRCSRKSFTCISKRLPAVRYGLPWNTRSDGGCGNALAGSRGFRQRTTRRHHTTGDLTLEGSDGMITDFASDWRFGNGGKPVHVVHRKLHQGRLTGFRAMTDGTVAYDIDLPDLTTMRAMEFEEKSDLNLLRGCSLKEVFLSVAHKRNLNRDYGYRNAIYDSLVSRRAIEGRDPIDPLDLLETHTDDAA